MDQITIIFFLTVCSVCVFKVNGKKENHLQKESLSTTSHKLETAKAIGVSNDDKSQVISGSSVKYHTNSLHTTAEMGNPSSARIKESKETPEKKTQVVADYSSKSVSKKRHKTTPRSTTARTTTEETTTESTPTETTIETTTEEVTTIETTTIEETTTETTTVEDTTTETAETTTTTTEDTTTKSVLGTQKTSAKPTPRLKSSPADGSSILNSSTKSWEKYLAKTTPLSKEHSVADTTAKMTSKSDEDLLMKSSEKANSNGQYQRTTTPFTYVNTRSPKDSVHDIPNQNGVKVKKTYTSLPNGEMTSETLTTPSNSSVDVKVDIDIDIKLRSSLISSTEGNSSVEYTSSQAPSLYQTTTSKNREERHQQKKKVLAGVILVVLISLSAAFAILFVLVPAKTEVRIRRYHRRPDQVELIAPGRRSRPRFYDASMYMGH